MSKELTTSGNDIALKLNEAVGSVINQTTLIGFERAYQTANAIQVLKDLLTPEYMKPILALQGNRLGFLTDKDRNGGYPEAVVKNCLIEAVLLGVQPYSNHFNIISNNTYLTKDGIGYVLNNWKGLSYDIVCHVPQIAQDGKTAVVQCHIQWVINGESKERTIPISVKNDQYTSVDSLIGKATRKSRAWLLSSISGVEVVEGDVQDISHVEIKSTKPNLAESTENKEYNRIVNHINKSATLEELEKCKGAIRDTDIDLIIAYDDKKRELSAK